MYEMAFLFIDEPLADADKIADVRVTCEKAGTRG
jgi:hypothetical protein